MTGRDTISANENPKINSVKSGDRRSNLLATLAGACESKRANRARARSRRSGSLELLIAQPLSCLLWYIVHRQREGQRFLRLISRFPLQSAGFWRQRHCLQGFAMSSFPGLEQCRSEEHTSELQSLMRISYAVFCL